MVGPRFFDLWIYHRMADEPRYLLMRTSQEKADRWSGGGRFWELPGDFYQEGESTLAAIRRFMGDLGLHPLAIGTSNYAYAAYNRRFDAVQLVPVFAAKVSGPKIIPLTWEHSESGWFTASECLERVTFWAFKEGLARTREYIAEPIVPYPELQLA